MVPGADALEHFREDTLTRQPIWNACFFHAFPSGGQIVGFMSKRAILAVTLYALSCFGPVHAQNASAERGKYLADLGDCSGCHTRQNGPAFSGGRKFTAAFGTLYSSNITPDKQTGIGGWTDTQFSRALHEGIRAHGGYLYPAFPYEYFTHIDRADTDALFAYLKTLKPVHATPTKNKLTFPFNIRAMMWFWNAMFLDKAPFHADVNKSAAWNRGAYIVTGLGHCAACHTLKNLLFGDKTDKAFTGATVAGWFSANLTGNKRDGLGRWTTADIEIYLKTGHNRYAAAAGSMQEVVSLSTSRMTDDDRAAIAAFLKSLPAAAEKPPPAPDADRMQAGEAVFVQSCSACHLRSDPTSPRDYPQLGGDTLVMGRDPTTVLRIVLAGAQSAVTPRALRPAQHLCLGEIIEFLFEEMISYERNIVERDSDRRIGRHRDCLGADAADLN